MHKLLIPVDGSENALRAVRHAVELAAQGMPVRVHLATVYQHPAVLGELALYVAEEELEAKLRAHSHQVLAPAEAMLRNAKIPFTSETRAGQTAPEIARSAQENGCDGIVMGTRGMGALGGLLLGSVATKVIHLAAVPVTLVK